MPSAGVGAVPGVDTVGVADAGRDHPGPGEADNGVAVSFAVTRRECERAVCGAGLTENITKEVSNQPQSNFRFE